MNTQKALKRLYEFSPNDKYSLKNNKIVFNRKLSNNEIFEGFITVSHVKDDLYRIVADTWKIKLFDNNSRILKILPKTLRNIFKSINDSFSITVKEKEDDIYYKEMKIKQEEVDKERKRKETLRMKILKELLPESMKDLKFIIHSYDLDKIFCFSYNEDSKHLHIRGRVYNNKIKDLMVCLYNSNSKKDIDNLLNSVQMNG